jgi:hypothetical protein
MDIVFKNNLGVAQMPCPEQHAWEGVNKRVLLLTYGAKRCTGSGDHAD